MEHPLSDREMNALLASEIFGHLACCENGRPYIVPLAYVFHENVIYGQTVEGKKTEILRTNPLVCFQVQKQINEEWKSVMCWGSFEEMDFQKLKTDEAISIVELLTKRLGSIQENVGIAIPRYSFTDKAVPLMTNNRKSTLFRIIVTKKTGRSYRSEKKD